jgi:hypothetical protein
MTAVSDSRKGDLQIAPDGGLESADPWSEIRDARWQPGAARVFVSSNVSDHF